MAAISIDPLSHRAAVNQDECVECFACQRMRTERLNPTLVRLFRGLLAIFRLRFDPEPDVCPTEAIEPVELVWPRIVRRAFSDPQVKHETTGIHGRGTAEVKTNDVTNRVQRGAAGFTVELGRPAVGVRFRDVDCMTRALAAKGAVFEEDNPITHLLANRTEGRIRQDILNEKVLSAIIEFKTSIDRVPEFLEQVEDTSRLLDTVVSMGVYARCDEQGNDELAPLLLAEGYDCLRAKTNVGLGHAQGDGHDKHASPHWDKGKPGE